MISCIFCNLNNMWLGTLLNSAISKLAYYNMDNYCELLKLIDEHHHCFSNFYTVNSGSICIIIVTIEISNVIIQIALLIKNNPLAISLF